MRNKLFKIFLVLTIFLLPWQTRWIFYQQQLSDSVWEYGRLGLYANMITLVLAAIFYFAQKDKLKIKNLFNSYRSRLFALTLVYFWVIHLWRALPEVAIYYLALMALTILFLFLLKQLSKKILASTLIVSGVVQGLLAIWQTMQQQILANKWLGIAEHLPASLGTAVVEHGLSRMLRVYGSLPHPNILGGFLCLAALAGLWWWVNIYRLAQKENWQGKKIKKYLVQLVLVLVSQSIIIFSLFLTFSRSAVLALAISLLIIFIWSLRKKRRLVTSVTVKLIILSSIIFVATHFLFPGAGMSGLQPSQRLEVKSTTERLVSWQQIDWHSPYELAFGQGLGLNTYKNLTAGQPAYEVQPIHNVFLLSLAEIGIVGFILLINLIYLYWPRYLAEDWFWFLSTFIVIGLFDHYFWTTWAGWMMVAIIFASLSQKKANNKY